MQPTPTDLPDEPPRKLQKTVPADNSPTPPQQPHPAPPNLSTLPLSEYVSNTTATPTILDPVNPSSTPSPIHQAKLAGFRAAVAARGAALILLAAGQGSRFVAETPKVVYPFAGKPLARHGLDAAAAAALPTVLVLGHQRHLVRKALNVREAEQVVYVCQEHQLGTGHAVYLATFALPQNLDADIVVSYADNPGIDKLLLDDILRAHEDNKQTYADSYAAMIVTGSRKAAGKGAAAYGRIVRANKDGTGPVVDIVEKKTIANLARDNQNRVYGDVTWTPTELDEIDEFNSGIVVARGTQYLDVLAGIMASQTKSNPPKYEYYATDFVKGLTKRTFITEGYRLPDDIMWKLEGANTLDELQELERKQIARDAAASAGKTGEKTSE